MNSNLITTGFVGPLVRALPALFALVITGITLPIILHLARRWSLYDTEGPLKIHTRRIPRLGGIALLVGVAAGMLSAGAVQSQTLLSLAVIALVWITGLVDDLRGLPPSLRLAVQLGAGFVLWEGGWSVSPFPNNTLSLLCTCLLVAAFINAFNLLDGADGVAAGVALVIALGYALLPGGEISRLGSILALSVTGGCAGFLLFNFPPARIFMGDSGSTMLGLSIAFLSLDFYRTSPSNASRWVVPALFAALPLTDLGLAIVRRLRKRAPLFAGDRQHFYDLLLQRGWPARRVAIVCALFTALLVVAGWLGDQQDRFVSSLILVIGIFPLVAIAVYLGSLRVDPGMRSNDSRA